MAKKDRLRDYDLNGFVTKGPVGDDKPHFHRNKLFGGLWRLAFVLIFFNLFGIHWNEKANPYFESILLEVFDKQNSVFFSSLIVAIGHIILLFMMVKGFYKTFTFGQYLRTFDEGNLSGYEYIRDPRSVSPNNSGLGRAYAYRESVMSSQTPERAANTLLSSSKIGFGSSTGKGYDKAAGYIDSKLSAMSPSSALEFLSRK